MSENGFIIAPGCRTNHNTGTECTACGTPLKRKLFKD